MTPKTKQRSRKKNTNISLGLVERLREDVLSERIRPGSKLTEKDICDQYEVSRTPVREALKNLESEGLIELIPNRGAFVIGFSLEDMKDLFELRKIYEIHAVKWAVARRNEDEVEELEKCFEYMKFYTNQRDLKKIKDINDNFHKIIYEASHNRTLINILSLYHYYIKHSCFTNTVDEYNIDRIFDEHTRIYEALMNQNIEAGVTAMEEHVANATERYLL